MRFILSLMLMFSASTMAQTTSSLPEAVRGVWLTNVASEALHSQTNIQQAVDLCADIGINTIFVVTWNKAQTLYPSAIMKQLTGVAMDPLMDPKNVGRDPLQELIDAAHARNIKVFAWFEFGFAASYDEQGGVLIDKKPHWQAMDQHGRLASKNRFEWLNAFDPDVQDFMTSLVLEVVNNYDIDGVQGDDRLPALPSNAGYNPDVVAEYRQQHNGAEPPRDHKDPDWVQWRADKLSQYAQTLYQAVKNADPEVIVSWSPSVYPWSKKEYLQDWPQWVRQGSVDLLIPQVYRYDIDNYRQTLKDNIQAMPDSAQARFFPGMLIQVDDYNPDDEFFIRMLQANREAGLLGEVFFFYEGLRHYAQPLKQHYQANPVRFPSWIDKE
ncbi:hypothetical protein HMF8227_00243 [Saliniradius amylolyticus]|uniref:Glycosyl hydrolase-like 10 domain-containing protein n=1 Tax=Saliniradius amylolyticus TaxID=2183582 RepID=A0A2S2DZD3_9ALTE|nr:family 10 glycosylhydrolase [Saliniradius amylolyticus]AWL10751.1 hypothetical protein HMF8227_00243 [Saliniradius amylolyticus]